MKWAEAECRLPSRAVERMQRTGDRRVVPVLPGLFRLELHRDEAGSRQEPGPTAGQLTPLLLALGLGLPSLPII